MNPVLRGVRTPVAVRSRTRRRSLDERVFVRFPALVRILALAWSRLPPRSRLRRAFLSRFLRQACEAGNRRDFDFLVLGLDPEVEYRRDERVPAGLAPTDRLGVIRGHEAYIQMWKGTTEVIEDFSLKHEEAIDFGDRVLAAGRMEGHGTSSGVPFSQPVFQVFALRRGLVFRQEDFADREKALDAAGLSE